VARENNRLSAIGLATRPPGFHADGRGLYFSVSGSGSRSWIFRYMLRGKSRDMGLGPFPDVGLAGARAKAEDARALCRDGVDPLERREADRKAKSLEEARSVTFRDCTTLYFEANKAAWRNPQHIRDWELSLKNHVFPAIGSSPVADVDIDEVLQVLEPIWLTTPVTAGRVRGRIESVLAYATARGYREGANPARWRHHLEYLLPRSKKVRAVRHHPALPFDQINGFVQHLRKQTEVAAEPLEFLILTAARSGEVMSAKSREVDLNRAVWTVPAERMKAGAVHHVPLSKAALAIVRPAVEAGQEFLFQANGRRLPGKSFFKLLRSMDRPDLTTHGFRSTFRDWAAATTDHANHVVEMALAHTVGKVEGAYRRDPMIEKRRSLMNDWADYVTQPPMSATVIPMRTAG
jgi:integrase